MWHYGQHRHIFLLSALLFAFLHPICRFLPLNFLPDMKIITLQRNWISENWSLKSYRSILNHPIKVFSGSQNGTWPICILWDERGRSYGQKFSCGKNRKLRDINTECHLFYPIPYKNSNVAFHCPQKWEFQSVLLCANYHVESCYRWVWANEANNNNRCIRVTFPTYNRNVVNSNVMELIVQNSNFRG